MEEYAAASLPLDTEEYRKRLEDGLISLSQHVVGLRLYAFKAEDRLLLKVELSGTVPRS